jgi:hypothetical protein
MHEVRKKEKVLDVRKINHPPLVIVMPILPAAAWKRRAIITCRTAFLNRLRPLCNIDISDIIVVHMSVP